MGHAFHLLVADAAFHRDPIAFLKPEDLFAKNNHVVCAVPTLQVQWPTEKNILERALLSALSRPAEQHSGLKLWVRSCVSNRGKSLGSKEAAH